MSNQKKNETPEQLFLYHHLSACLGTTNDFLAYRYKELEEMEKNPLGYKLRWIRKLDPSPYWQRLVKFTYETTCMYMEKWTVTSFLLKIAQTYELWRPGRIQNKTREVISRTAVIAIVLTNPTPLTIGLYLVHLCCDLGLTVSMVLESLGKMLVTAVTLSISALKQLIEAMISMISKASSAATTPEEIEMQEWNAYSTFDLSTLVQSLTAMAGVVASTVKGISETEMIKCLGKCTKLLANCARAGKAVEYLFVKVQSCISFILGWIYPDKEIMRLVDVLIKYDLKIDGVSVSVTDYLAALSDRSTAASAAEMKSDIAFLRTSRQLLDDTKLMALDLNGSSKDLLNPLIIKLEKVVFEATAQSCVNTRKFEPYHVSLTGEPGLGKSVALNVTMELVKQHLLIRPEYDFPLNEQYHSFAWTFDENFVSGYKGQYMVYMDDICKEAKAGPGTSTKALFNIVSNVGTNVAGAAISEKVNPFSSRMIFSTTNVPYPSAQSLDVKNSEAWWRRRHLLFKMVPSDTMDPNLNRMASFQLMDPRDPKQILGPKIDFEAFVKHILVGYKEHFAKEMHIGDMASWAQRIMADTDIVEGEAHFLPSPFPPVEEEDESDSDQETEFVNLISDDEESNDDDVARHVLDISALPEGVSNPHKLPIYHRWQNGVVTSHSIYEARNPYALMTVSFMMNPDAMRIVENGVTYYIWKLDYYRIKQFYNLHGWDYEKAISFCGAYNVDCDHQLAYEIDEGHVLEWHEGDTPCSFQGVIKNVGDALFDEGIEGVAYSIIDAATLSRVRIKAWVSRVQKWQITLGISAIVATVVAIGLYLQRNKNSPYYNASGMFDFSLNKTHETMSEFGKARARQVYFMTVNGAGSTGFMYENRSFLTTRHSFLTAKEGCDMSVIINNVPYSEKFDSANLEILEKGSDLAVYHFQNKQLPMAPNARSLFAKFPNKETMQTELLTHCGFIKATGRVGGAFNYTSQGKRFTHRETIVVEKASTYGNSGSLMVVPGLNKIVGVLLGGGKNMTFCEFITEDYLPPSRDLSIEVEGEAHCGLEFVGMVDKPVASMRKTKYKPSLISSFMAVCYATLFQPAALYNDDKRLDNPGPDLLEKSMNGYNRDYPTLDSKLKKRIVRDFSYEDLLVRKGVKRLLTNQEIINGCPELNVKPFEISTSPGLPWIHEKSLKGKRDHIIGDLPFREMSGELLKAVDEFDFDGEVTGYSCLKDELRPIQKIKEGKTRSFIVLPMDFNLVLRKYFGAFIGVQHSLAGRISSCVGINPYEDWDMMYTRLAQCSDQWEDFDYKEWDRSLLPEWFSIYADRTSEWYGDGPVNKYRRQQLMRMLSFSLVQVGDKLFRTKGGNKSGVAITAEINCDVQDMLLYYCWMVLAKKFDLNKDNFHDFRKSNEFLIYGDDLVKATRDAPWFNGNNLHPLMKSLGMDITPADKNGTTFVIKDPSSVQFLKRSFGSRTCFGKMMCPLDTNSINKMVHFIKESDDVHYSLKMNIDCATKEMFFHGKDEYDKFTQNVQEACKKVSLKHVPIWKEWEELEEEWLSNDLEPPTYW
jgi:hypothetical protein